MAELLGLIREHPGLLRSVVLLAGGVVGLALDHVGVGDPWDQEVGRDGNCAVSGSAE